MSQHDYVIANQTFPATRTDINNALGAVVSTNAGATAPSTTYAYQLWYDTGNDDLKMRNADNDAWIALFSFDQTADTALVSGAGGITFPDSAKAIFGAGSDLQIYHDGSHSYVKDAGTGNLYIEGTNLRLGYANGEYAMIAGENGSVEILHDNATKLSTTATGVDVTGGLNTTDFDVIPTGSSNYYPQIGGGVDGGADAYLALSGGTSGNGNLAIKARGTYGEIKFFTGGSSGSASTTERLRITSTGKVETKNRDFGFHNHGTQVTLADDAFITINAGTAGGGLLAIYETASGGNALFRVGYGNCAAISGAGGISFLATDTDGAVCIFSSGHNIYIKNRLGATKGFFINMFIAGNDFVG